MSEMGVSLYTHTHLKLHATVIHHASSELVCISSFMCSQIHYLKEIIIVEVN